MKSIIQKSLLITTVILSVFFCTSLLINSPAYALDDSLMGKTPDFVLSKIGKPDRVVEFSPVEIRFIYGETQEGAAVWAEYYITESFMVTFKKGKVVVVSKSFVGSIDNDGAPMDFPRLKQYMTEALKNLKPVVQKGSSGKWAGVSWNGAKYNYWARCITKDIAYDKTSKGFKLKDIKSINDYYLVQYEVVENNYYKEKYKN